MQALASSASTNRFLYVPMLVPPYLQFTGDTATVCCPSLLSFSQLHPSAWLRTQGLTQDNNEQQY